MADVLAQGSTANEGRYGGAVTEGQYLSWEELCPRDMDAELYRDVEPEAES